MSRTPGQRLNIHFLHCHSFSRINYGFISISILFKRFILTFTWFALKAKLSQRAFKGCKISPDGKPLVVHTSEQACVVGTRGFI